MSSVIFQEFIRKYPNSSSADEYRMWGEKLLEYSGHFTCFLFTGDILSALHHADSINKKYLHDLLVPGWDEALLKEWEKTKCEGCECIHPDDIDPSDYSNEAWE